MSKNPLPKIKTSQYSTTLPISEKEVLYRGYNVSDERILISAIEAKDEDPKFYADNILNVITSTILNDVNVRKLPSADVRYLLLHIRSKSVGEVIELKYNNKPLNIDIQKIFIHGIRKNADDYKIQIDDDLFLQMKELTFEDELFAAASANENNKGSVIYKLLVSSIDAVYNSKDSWVVGEDITTKQLEELINDIPTSISSKLFEFINNMPVLAVELEIDGEKKIVTNKELDFLASASATST